VKIRQLLAFAIITTAVGAVAAQGALELRVGATVLARASMQSAPPSHVQVTAGDVERGYVDVDNVAYSIRTNSLRGAVLAFTPVGELAQQTQVTGLSAPVQLGAAGGVVSVPRVSTQPTQGTFTFRFYLPRDARPGQYPWPLQITAQPA